MWMNMFLSSLDAFCTALQTKHYQKQSDYLKDKDKKLSRITARLAKEEEEHFNLATQHDTGRGYYSKVLKFGIKTISKVAIKLSEKI